MASEQEHRRLIVVSNRLPISVKGADGGYKSLLSSGGLVNVIVRFDQVDNVHWFGWPGIDANDPKDRNKISRSLTEHHTVGVFLNKKLADEHYNNLCSMSLHPTVQRKRS